MDEGAEELHGYPTVRQFTTQILDHRSKIEEVVPKMTHPRGSDASKSRKI